MRDPNKEILPSTRPNAFHTRGDQEEDWNPALNLLRDTLATFSSIRGGRAKASSSMVKSRSRTARIEEVGVRRTNIMTMLLAVVASSVGAAWTPNPDLNSNSSFNNAIFKAGSGWGGRDALRDPASDLRICTFVDPWTAVLQGDMDAAVEILPSIPKEQEQDCTFLGGTRYGYHCSRRALIHNSAP